MRRVEDEQTGGILLDSRVLVSIERDIFILISAGNSWNWIMRIALGRIMSSIIQGIEIDAECIVQFLEVGQTWLSTAAVAYCSCHWHR